MEIRNPRRLLCLGFPESGVLGLLKELTGTSPTPRTISTVDHEARGAEDVARTSPETKNITTTTAGLTHILPIKTKYYHATIPVWLDEVPNHGAIDKKSYMSDLDSMTPLDGGDSNTPAADGVSAWKEDFLDPVAAEVTSSLGAWVIVFRKYPNPSHRSKVEALIKAVEEVVERQGEGLWDGVLLAVATKASGFIQANQEAFTKEQSGGDACWEEFCFEHGFEYIDGTISASQGRQRDAIGEVKGIARLREALEACDWTAQQQSDNSADGLADLDIEEDFGEAIESGETSAGFEIEGTQLGNEFAALSNSLRQHDSDGHLHSVDDDDKEEQVEELEKMMSKMLAARDMSAHLPLEQRKRLAAKAVAELLHE